jgi:hypothetical protein
LNVDRREASPGWAARLTLALLTVLAALLMPSRGDVVAEDLALQDPTLASALEVLDGSPWTGDIRGVLTANHVNLQFVPMATGVYARYNVGRRTIEIDDRWSDADRTTIAAVIAHEATHARDAASGYLDGGPSACVDSEIHAFRTSALFWSGVYGRSGKPGVTDDLERQLNLIAERELIDPDGLDQLVRQAYATQCGR